MEVSSVSPSCSYPEGGDYGNRTSGAIYSNPPSNPRGDNNFQSSENAQPSAPHEGHGYLPSSESLGHRKINCCHVPNPDHLNSYVCNPDQSTVVDPSIAPVQPSHDSHHRPSSQQSRQSTENHNESAHSLPMDQHTGSRSNDHNQEYEEQPIRGSTLESGSEQYPKPVEVYSNRCDTPTVAKQSKHSRSHCLESPSNQLNARPETCHQPFNYSQSHTVQPSIHLQIQSPSIHIQQTEDTAFSPPSALKLKEESQANLLTNFSQSVSKNPRTADGQTSILNKTSKEQDTVASLMIPESLSITPSNNTSLEPQSANSRKFNPVSLTHLNFKDKQLALSAIKKAATNMSCVQMFQDKDKLNSGKIGRRDFQIVMDRIGVLNGMSSREIDAVFKGFSASTETELDYKRFVAACRHAFEGDHRLARMVQK